MVHVTGNKSKESGGVPDGELKKNDAEKNVN